jgi:class 3 adenylate cyclase
MNKDINTELEKATKYTLKKKVIAPNLIRVAYSFLILFIIPDNFKLLKYFNYVFVWFSITWTFLEIIYTLDYKKFSFLPYLPATLDLFIVFSLMYITGNGNSFTIAIIVCLIMASTIMSPENRQAEYNLILSIILFILIHTLIYFNIIPVINIINFSDNEKMELKLFVSFSIFLLVTAGAHFTVKKAFKEQLRLEKRMKKYAIIASNEKLKLNNLLKNILPSQIIHELKRNGNSKPKKYNSVTVVFTDFSGFTNIAESLEAEELVNELDKYFSYFDSVVNKYKLEKIKTIGDAYMACGGIPEPTNTHPIDCILACLEIQAFMNKMKEIKSLLNLPYWDIRIGVNTGSLIAGVIGEMKFTYDVFGDTVNIASRMESSGEIGKINISQNTYDLVKDFFDCEYRGKIPAKNKGTVDMYYVTGIKAQFSLNGERKVPNDEFKRKLESLCKEI